MLIADELLLLAIDDDTGKTTGYSTYLDAGLCLKFRTVTTRCLRGFCGVLLETVGNF